MNNAGVGCGGYLWENSERDWQWVMGVNLMGVVHGIRHFVPRMLAALGHPVTLVTAFDSGLGHAHALMSLYGMVRFLA